MSSLGSSSLGTADIVGIAVGGVLAIATIIGIIISCYAMCCKKNHPPQVAPYPPPYYQQNPYGQPMNTGYYAQQPHWGQQPTNNPQQQPYYAPKSNY